jgi:hypothetical protein
MEMSHPDEDVSCLHYYNDLLKVNNTLFPDNKESFEEFLGITNCSVLEYCYDTEIEDAKKDLLKSE